MSGESAASPSGKVDSETLTLRAAPRPTTRLNRRTLAGLIGVVAVAVLLATVFALQPRTRPQASSVQEEPRTERVPRAEGLNALPRDYASMPAPVQLGPPLGELGRARLASQERIDAHSADGQMQPYREMGIGNGDRASERARVSAEAAAKAPVFFQLTRRSAPGNSPESALAGVDGGVPSAPAASGQTEQRGDELAAQNGQRDKRAFLNGRIDATTYAQHSLETPRSPYQLLAGTIISAALVTGINSDLPGQIIASVTENIFDTVTGRHMLIPQGAKLIGEYDSQVAFGQRRVLMAWTRLILPDGSSIVLDRLQGFDTAGRAGLEDGVDWHWRRLLAGAALSTVVGVGAELAAPDRSDGDVVIATRESAQETINEVGQQITRRNLNVQPTLTVRPGYPLRIIVNKDLILRPHNVNARGIAYDD